MSWNEYKGHTFEVITSQSCLDVLEKYCGENEEAEQKELEAIVDEWFNIEQDYGFESYASYPIIYSFEDDSRKIYNKIKRKAKNADEIYEYVEEDLRVWTNHIDELDQHVVDKNGCDLVKWDTGFIGLVGYGNGGVTAGLEMLPIKMF